MTDELAGATASGVRWVSAARACTEIVLLGALVVLAHVIPPADFGRFAVAVIVQELAISVPTEGIGSALVQRREVRRAHLQTGAFAVLALAVALTALTLVLASVLVAPLLGEGTADLVRLSTPTFLLAAIGVVSVAQLRRRLDFRRLALIDVSSAGTRAFATLALALVVGLDGSALVLGALAGTTVATLLALAWAPPPLPRADLGALRELRGYGLPASLASACWVGFRNADYAIVGAKLGVGAAGLYWRAYQLAVEYQRKISIVMYQVAFPVLSRAAGSVELHAMRARMIRLLAVVLFPMLAVLAVTAPTIVPFVLGARWTPAVVPTQILCAAGAISIVIDAAGTALMASGRARALLGYGVGHFAIYAGAVVLVAGQGITAVAIAAVVVHGAFLLVAYGVLLPGSPRRALAALWSDTGPAVCGCAALLVPALAAEMLLGAAGVPGGLRLAAVVAVGAPVYLLAVRAASPAAWSDLIGMLSRIRPSSTPPPASPPLSPGRAPVPAPTPTPAPSELLDSPRLARPTRSHA